MFTQQDTDRLLGLKSASSTKATTGNKGPGEFDDRKFMAKHKDIWRQVSPHPDSSKRKIIFCEPFEGIIPAHPFALAFIGSLVNHYHVYLWPGSRTPFKNERPLASPMEFWQRKPLMQAARKNDVIDALAYQGIAASPYLIIDDHTYKEIFARFLEEFKHREIFETEMLEYLRYHTTSVLDLLFTPPSSFNQLFDSLNSEEITTIITYPPTSAELHEFKHAFPNLACIIIKNATPGWFMKNKSGLSGIKRVELEDFLVAEKFELPSDTILHTLRISPGDYIKFKSFTVAKHTKVQALELTGLHECDLSKASELKSLTLQDCDLDERLDIAKDNKLEKLVLRHSPCKLNLDKLRNLKHLSITGKSSVELGNPNWVYRALKKVGINSKQDVPQLEILELGSSAGSSCVIDLSRDKQLQNVSILEGEEENWKLSLPKHKFKMDKQKVVQEKIKVALPTIQWDVAGNNHIKKNVEQTRYIKLSEGSWGTYGWFGDYPKLESIKIAGSMPTTHNLQAAPRSLKSFELYTQPGNSFKNDYTPRLIDFSNKSKMVNCRYRSRQKMDHKFKFTGCHALIHLEIDIGINTVILEGMEDCHALRSLRIRAVNADIVTLALSGVLPESCIVHYYVDTPADQSNKKSNNSVKICNISCTKPVCIPTFLILLVLATGVMAFMIYEIINRTSHNDSGSTQPSSSTSTSFSTSTSTLSSSGYTSSHTSPASTTSPGISSALKIALGAGSSLAVLTLIVATTLLIRRNRSKNNEEAIQANNLLSPFSIKHRHALLKDDYKFNERFKYNAFTGKKIDINHIRLQAQNAMLIKRDKIYLYNDKFELAPVNVTENLIEDKADAKISHLLMRMLQAEDEALHYIEGELEAGKIYPLPELEAMPDEHHLIAIYTQKRGLVQFYYQQSTQKFYFGLHDERNKNQDGKIIFYYHVKRNLAYNNIPFFKDSKGAEHISHDAVPVMENPDTLLPNEIIEYGRHRLARHSQFTLLFNSNTNPITKLNLLIDYFRSIESDELDTTTNSDLEYLFDLIIENKGVCRHASIAFFTVARMLGFPVITIGNCGYQGRLIGHQFCAIPFRTADGVQYQRVDLTLPDYTPEISDDDVFRKLKITTAKKIAIEHDDADDTAPMEAYNSAFALFKKALKVDDLSDINEILKNPSLFAPLIELTDNHTAQSVNAEITRQLRACGFNLLTQHLYIHSPSDLITYFHSRKIANGTMTEISGPLRNLLLEKDKPCVLVVNWGNFSADQLASYQSLIDSPPFLTLEGETIHFSKNIIIIGMISKSATVGKVFQSRSKRWQLSPDFFKSLVMTPSSERIQCEIIDLNHRLAFGDELFYEIEHQGRSINLIPTALPRAISNNKPLLVYNPPNDDEFNQVQHQINGERKIFINGEFITVPDGISIYTATRENSVSADNIKLHTDEKGLEQLDKIHLSLINWHELRKQMHIDAQHNAHTLKGGLLQSFNPTEQIFYLHGQIPASQWQQLIARIRTLYPQKLFQFLLAPGASVEDICENPAMSVKSISLEELNKFNHKVFFTNDVDMVTDALSQQIPDSLIRHVAEFTKFSELIASTEYVDELGHFTYTELPLLRALRAAKTIILSGVMSLGLFYQLQSLLSDNPNILLNGIKQQLSGKLILVLPEYLQSIFNGIGVKCTVTLQDYQARLAREKYTNPANLKNLLSFQEHVFQLPHVGKDRPPKRPFTYQRIKKMLDIMNAKSGIHEHNPIKPYLNYHYPRHSEDEAYVNVMAKYFLTPEDKSPVRINKLKNLFAKYLITQTDHLKQHVWKILNCFNGAKLTALFANEISMVKRHQGYPTLTDASIEVLLDLCNQIISTPDRHLPVKVARTQKQLLLLKDALQDPTNKVILLKGEPGIGKTYTMRKLVGTYFEGEEGFHAYLRQQDIGLPIIFLWDEGTREPPGKLDAIIKALHAGVYTDGEETFQLTSSFKLVITANPESYPDCHYHDAILDYAHVIYFDAPEDEFLLNLACQILPGELHEYSQTLLYAYHRIKIYNPFFVTSIRDIESLAFRFLFLYDTLPQKNQKEIRRALYKACKIEFAGAIRDISEREQFTNDIREQLGLLKEYHSQSLIVVTDDYSTTPEKYYLVEAIEMDLDIRLMMLYQRELKQCSTRSSAKLFDDKGKEEEDATREYYCKPALIIEGESGVGKSSLLRAMLQRHHTKLMRMRDEITSRTPEFKTQIMLKVINRELAKPVYEFSAGSSDANQSLLPAFEDEAFLICDEVNIDAKFNEMLLQLLSGVDAKRRPTNKKGFMPLCSQNPPAYDGRPDSSQAAINRGHFMYMDDFSDNEYLMFAKAAQLPFPRQFVAAFNDARRLYPAANTRTFHQVLKVAAKQLTQSPIKYDDMQLQQLIIQDDQPEEFIDNENEPLLKLRN